MEPDLSLYYQEQGTGEPLVLLHGNGEDHTYFRRQIEAFSREYRVIAVDKRPWEIPQGNSALYPEAVRGRPDGAFSQAEAF